MLDIGEASVEDGEGERDEQERGDADAGALFAVARQGVRTGGREQRVPMAEA